MPLLLAGLLCSGLRAQAPRLPVSLNEYLSQAGRANPDLRAFSLRYDAAMERIPQLAALPDPMLQVSHFVESVQTRTGPQENIFMLSQRLPWFGRLSGRQDLASTEAEAVWFASQNRQLQLAGTVAHGYYNYAFNGKAIELTAANLNLLQKLEPVVEERSRTGGDLNALLRLKVEIGRLNDKLITLQQQRPQLSARLAAVLALPADTLLPWPDWLVGSSDALPALPDLTSTLAAIDAHNPELQMLDRQLAGADVRRELARLESRPDVTVGLNYIQIDRSTMTPAPAGSGRDPWSVSVAVNLPIWGGRVGAGRREADARHAAVVAERDNRRNELLAEARATHLALADAHRRVALYRDQLLPLARQATQNTYASFEGGRATLLDVIDSERSLLELDLALAQATTDAAQRRVTLLTLANQPL